MAGQAKPLPLLQPGDQVSLSLMATAIVCPPPSGISFCDGLSLPGCLFVGLGLRLLGRVGCLAFFALAALEVVIWFACRDRYSDFSVIEVDPGHEVR